MLHNRNCFDVIDSIGPLGAVITDPPVKVYYDDTRDHLTNTRWLAKMREIAPQVIVLATPGANWPTPDRIVKWHWDTVSDINVYGNWDGPLEIHEPWPVREAFGHGSVKPLPLLRLLVSNTVGTVFDPFMGTGTTGVACIEQRRRFHGCEIDASHFATAQRRIGEAMSDAA